MLAYLSVKVLGAQAIISKIFLLFMGGGSVAGAEVSGQIIVDPDASRFFNHGSRAASSGVFILLEPCTQWWQYMLPDMLRHFAFWQSKQLFQ